MKFVCTVEESARRISDKPDSSWSSGAVNDGETIIIDRQFVKLSRPGHSGKLSSDGHIYPGSLGLLLRPIFNDSEFDFFLSSFEIASSSRRTVVRSTGSVIRARILLGSTLAGGCPAEIAGGDVMMRANQRTSLFRNIDCLLFVS